MPVSLISIPPALPASAAPTGGPAKAAAAKTRDGIEPDFQSLLSDQGTAGVASVPARTVGPALASFAKNLALPKSDGPAAPAGPATPSGSTTKAQAAVQTVPGPQGGAKVIVNGVAKDDAGKAPTTAPTVSAVPPDAAAVLLAVAQAAPVRPVTADGPSAPTPPPSPGTVEAAAALVAAATGPVGLPPAPSPRTGATPVASPTPAGIASVPLASSTPGAISSVPLAAVQGAGSRPTDGEGRAPTQAPADDGSAAGSSALLAARAGSNAPDKTASTPLFPAESASSSNGAATSLQAHAEGGGEKFADSGPTDDEAVVTMGGKSNKNSLVVTVEYVASATNPVGTSVAMPTPAMTATASAQPPVTASALPSPAAQSAAGASAAVALASPTRAVESVLQVADLQAAQSQATQSSVNLHFTVAGEALSVRVSVQEGQVHTQFSTDSGELRSALAHEWQSMAPSSTGTARFAEPVFTSGPRGDPKTATDLAGDGGQQAGQRRQGSDANGSPQVLNRAPAPTLKAPVAAAAPQIEPEGPVVLGRLHSFA